MKGYQVIKTERKVVSEDVEGLISFLDKLNKDRKNGKRLSTIDEKRKEAKIRKWCTAL